MPSNARMTFRFEPQPAPKPAKPAAAAQPDARAMGPNPSREIEAMPLAPVPVPAAEQAPPRHAEYTQPDRLETIPERDGPYQDDIRALEDMIRRTDAVVVPLPPQTTAPKSKPQQPAQQQPQRQRQPSSTPPKPTLKLEEYATASPLLDLSELAERKPQRPSKRPAFVRELEQTEPDHELPERWSLPEPTEDERRATSGWLSHGGAYTRNAGPSWTRVILSVAAAIVTGALFGYMVLTLFTGQPIFPSDNAANQTAATATGQPSATTTTATANAGETSGAKAPPSAATAGGGTDVPASEAYILQYGVFKSADSTQLAMAQLQDVGLPAAADDADGYRVYAGIASTKEEAEQLAAQMPNIAVYIRPIAGASLALGTDDRSRAIASLLGRSAALGKLVSRLTVSGLNDELPLPFAAADEEALKQAGADWRQTPKADDSLTGQAAEAARTLEESLSAALQSLDDYASKQSRYHLWHAQTAILQAQLADRDLREALSPATSG